MDTLHNFANEAMLREDWTSSEKYWKEILTAKVGDREALYNLGLTQLKLANFDESLLHAERGLETDKDDVKFLRLRMFSAYHKMDFFLAIDSAKKSLIKEPGDVQAWRILVLSEILSGELEQVRKDIQVAKSRFTDDILFNLIQCKIAILDDDFKKAKSLIPFLLKNANNEPEVIKLLGTLLLKIGDKKRAINIYEKALSLGVVDIDILNSLGWYALAEKKFEKAADHFNRSLELFRVQVDANLGMGYYHLNLCMYDLAKKHCDVAIKLNAADIRGWELCLFIAHKMNDRVLGKEAYKYIKNLQRDK